MDIQRAAADGLIFSLPAYYGAADPGPEDPAGAVSFAVRSSFAQCFLTASPITEEAAMAWDTASVIAGIRTYLGEKQGLIEVEAGEDWLYSIVKSLKEPSGVQYALTLQKKYPGGHILLVQGWFDEDGPTGIREVMSFEYCRRQGQVGTDDDPTAGWARDPYDAAVTKGALMNLSEQAELDARFPGFPLTICRETARVLTGTAE